MGRPRIVIVTRAFPYPPGEQFVAPEAAFWARADAEVVVMPARIEGEPWASLPEGVTIDRTLADLSRRTLQRYRMQALASPLLAREVAFLARSGRLGRATVTEAVRAVSGAIMVRDALAQWTRVHGPIDLLYGYWYDVWPMGAQLLRGDARSTPRGRRVGHVVSRVHGYDLYEHRNPGGFQGLKRQLAPQLDALLPISQQGGQYAVDTYGVAPALVRPSPLGVQVPQTSASTSPEGELHVLSCAMVSPVKRVDRLADAVRQLAQRHPEVQVHWTHLGGGDLLDQVRATVEGAAPNLHTRFPGTVDNEAVREHLATSQIGRAHV